MNTPVPYIPDTAPFTSEQRAWLNGFLAGLFSQPPPKPAPSPKLNGAIQPTGEPLLILFGSQSGTAEGLAKRLAKECEARGFASRVLALNDYAKGNLPAGGKAVIISSTWGDGDPPDNAANFWTWLKSENAPRLENLQFAVLGLGDRNYSDFCGASKKFDARLEALGARRLCPRGECDVDYEEAAKRWTDSLWERIANGSEAMPPALKNGTHEASPSLNGSHKLSGPVYSRSNPFPAKLLKNVLLNKPGSAKEVRHYEIDLGGSGLTYQVGDALGIAPTNCPALVADCLAALRCTGDEPLKCGEVEMPAREAFTRQFDLRQPGIELLRAIAARLPDIEFAPLLAPESAGTLKEWLKGREIVDVLLLAGETLSLHELPPLLRKLAPRLYSISSSPKAHPDEVHVTVSTVRYESLRRGRKGVASTFLADRVNNDEGLKVFIQSSTGFRLPPDETTPMIMVGPGTGIAPFRAFLEEREVVGAKGMNWLLFGDQCRATDLLYEDQLVGWQKSGLLTRLDLAFSRDQKEKVYVQHRLIENASEVWAWLENGAHFYVCGDATRMAKDVDAALHQVIQQAGGKSPDQAEAFVAAMKSEKRYQRDVY